MSELENVIKLREWLDCKVKRFDFEHSTIVLNRGVNPNDLYYLADEIEREVSECYMLLPKDAEGVPIHVGDVLITLSGCKKQVDGIFTDGFAVHKEFTDYDKCYSADFIHVKQSTIEDVLRQFIIDAKEYHTTDSFNDLIKEYADELRGVMEAVND